MAVTLTGAAGLFTNLGKIFYAIEVLNTARGSTVEAEVIDAIDQFENIANTIEMQAVIEDSGLAANMTSWREDNTLAESLRQFAENLIIRMVNDDNEQEDLSIETAIVELIDQMEGAGGETNPDDDLDASTAAVSVTVGGSNNGDGVVVASVIGGDGRNREVALPEDIEVRVSSTAGDGTLTFEGESDEGVSLLSSQWPKGSGVSTSLSAVQASGGLLANGGMDDEDDRANTPDDWVIETGFANIGTTILMSDYEVQTVIISGTPTSGTYELTYTSADSDVQTTAPLAYNASGAAVQTALRALEGLGNITVSTTGTSPNYTHTITFEKMDPPGTVGNLTSNENFDAGSIAHANVTQSTAHVYRDKCLIFDSDAAELTSIKQRIDHQLAARTVYAVCAWMKVDAYPAAGTMIMDLVDGAGTVINDVQGAANSISINPQSGGDLSTSAFTAITGFFRTPTVLPEIAYLRIRISVAISATASVFIDEVTLIEATELYAGGPFVAVFAGATPFGILDEWTIPVTNDWAGKFQTYFRRCFDNPGVLLPSDTGGTETIDDALIV
jgi:hypothetical protein